MLKQKAIHVYRYFSYHKKKLAISAFIYLIGLTVFLFGRMYENIALQVTGPIIIVISKIFIGIAMFGTAFWKFIVLSSKTIVKFVKK